MKRRRSAGAAAATNGLSPRSPNVTQQDQMRGKRRCLGAEGVGASIPSRHDAGGGGVPGATGLAPGTRVMVVGMTSLTNPWKGIELNGKKGTVEVFDAQTRLHTVRLDGTGAQVLKLEQAQCQPIPQFIPQQNARAATTPSHQRSPATNQSATQVPASPSATQAMAGVPPGINPSLLINILSTLGQEDRSKVIRVCSDFMDHTAAATAAATTDTANVAAAAPNSPPVMQAPPCVPAGTPNLAEMPQASPISPTPSAAPSAFPTPGLVFMATGSPTDSLRKQEKRACELKHHFDKAANQNKQSRRQGQAKRQKQQRKDKFKARRVAAASAASAATAEPALGTVGISQTPATTHGEQSCAVPAPGSARQSAVPTPIVTDTTHAVNMAPQVAMPQAAASAEQEQSTEQSPVAPTPMLPGKSDSAKRQRHEPIGADEPRQGCASGASVCIEKMVPEVSEHPGPAADPSTGCSQASIASRPMPHQVSPGPSAAKPDAGTGAATTAKGTAQDAAPTPISSEETNDIAPTPATAATPSAKKTTSASRPVRFSRTAKTSETTGIPANVQPSPNTAAARSAEDSARAAAVRESKKAAEAIRKEKELQKKQTQAVQRLREANSNAVSEQVSCGPPSATNLVDQRYLLTQYSTNASGSKTTVVSEN